MNESEFEDELRALRPIQPSPETAAVISRALKSEPSPVERAGLISKPAESLASRILTGFCWAAGGAAVALLVFMFGPELRSSEAKAPMTSTASIPDNGFQRTASSRELIRAEDGGVYYNTDHQPEEVLRYSSVERHTWKNPATGARVVVEVPREDVVVIPVSFQ